MSKLIRYAVIALTLAVILGLMNQQISRLNAIRADGQDLLLKLRPVDPRALMQGDYMALRYDRQAYPETDGDLPTSGTVILLRDAQNVGRFARFDDGGDLRPNELRLSYARRFAGDVNYGGARYFFEEGTAETFENAEYGVFKVSPDGQAILTGLASAEYARLSAP